MSAVSSSADQPRRCAVVANELNRSPPLLALDLSGVIRIDAVGIHALVSAATQAGESDISLCLVGVHGHPVGTAIADAELWSSLRFSQQTATRKRQNAGHWIGRRRSGVGITGLSSSATVLAGQSGHSLGR